MSNNLDHISVMLPDQRNYEVAYGLAYKLAAEKLVLTTDVEEMCLRSGSVLISGDNQIAIGIQFLNSQYRVTLPEVGIIKIRESDPIELRDKILILHYLLTASGRPLSGKMIGFKELGEGMAYFPTFSQRTIKPMVTFFGENPERLITCAAAIGGAKSDLGDFAVTIPAFPKLALTFVLWRGDEEFPSEGNILFDSNALDYLPLEDIIVLCQSVVGRLIKSLKSQEGGNL